MNRITQVGMGEMNVVCAPGRIRTSGLGSCVAVTLYDPLPKIAGLAHIMLPSFREFKNQQRQKNGQGEGKESKYADLAIPLLVEKMKEKGGHPHRLQSKLVGGAQMFAFLPANEAMRIGPRNVHACRQWLKKVGIPIIAEDIGGHAGRTIHLDATTGKLYIHTVYQGWQKV